MLEIPDRSSGCGCWVAWVSFRFVEQEDRVCVWLLSVYVWLLSVYVLFDVCRSDVQRKVEERRRIDFEVKVRRSCQ